jgi:hypothetical protein
VALGGRRVEAPGAVDGAARDAARAASLARQPGDGPLGEQFLAEQAAGGDLSGWCPGQYLSVTVSPPALDAPTALGQSVTVTVHCSIDTSIFGIFSLGARHTVTGVAVAPLDPYMCRGAACDG